MHPAMITGAQTRADSCSDLSVFTLYNNPASTHFPRSHRARLLLLYELVKSHFWVVSYYIATLLATTHVLVDVSMTFLCLNIEHLVGCFVIYTGRVRGCRVFF